MKLVILGGGESGTGAAVLGKQKGWEVFLSDKSPLKEVYKKELDAKGIRWEEGQHTESEILSADCIIKSPGIPHKVPIVQQAKAKGIEIISEIEFASRYTDAKIIAITGSNGKTTTTTLVYHLLKEAGLSVAVGGNIGYSFARLVAQEPKEYYVLEISSFQLDDVQNFRPYISLLLNLSPDHLDQYNYNYKEYALAKFRIVENQENGDYFIYNKDDEMSEKLLGKLDIKAKLLPFSFHEELEQGGFVADNKIFVKLQDEFSMLIKDIGLAGKHNIANCLAASIVSKLLSINNESIENSLMTFRAVEHRLEKFAEIDGVNYINDSKATNVNATYFALESMETPVIWIVGGVDKGNDYGEIEELVKKKVKAIICLGLNNEKIIKFFQESKELIFDTSNIEDCVKIAKNIAQKGDSVLLSPCCASFDLFDNYEDRGEKFKAEVSK